MNQLRIRAEQQGEVLLLHLAGEADLPSVPDLVRVLRPAIDGGRRVVVDISGLEFCSFSVLSALDRWRITGSSCGGVLRVAGLNPRLRSVLKRIGMADLLMPELAVGNPSMQALDENSR